MKWKLAKHPVVQTGRKLLRYSNAVRFSSRAENWSLIDSLASLIILLLNDALTTDTQALRVLRRRTACLLSDGGPVVPTESVHYTIRTSTEREGIVPLILELSYKWWVVSITVQRLYILKGLPLPPGRRGKEVFPISIGNWGPLLRMGR
jgi:hypothetical protein